MRPVLRWHDQPLNPLLLIAVNNGGITNSYDPNIIIYLSLKLVATRLSLNDRNHADALVSDLEYIGGLLLYYQ